MLYEFGYQFHILDIFKVLFFILPFCLYIFSSCFDNKIIRLIIVVLALFLIIFFLVMFCVKPICSYMKIKQNIDTGNIYIVEGEVSDFNTPESSFGGHDSESFTIDDVNFCYYGTENYGYSKFLCNGGVVTGNGQKLRITYCNDPFTDELVICYIEKAED